MDAGVGFYLVIIFGLFTKLTAATDILCYEDSEFKRYTTPLKWQEARKICRSDFGGDLAKVDTMDLSKKILDTYFRGIRIISFIGGTRTNGEFSWLDGTKLTAGNLVYVENGNDKNCLRLNIVPDNPNPNWASTDCNGLEPFICQRNKSAPVIKNDAEVISSTQQSITCKTDWCSPTWTSKDGNDMPICGEQSNRVCQNVSSTKSRLWFNNASERDSGVYRCKTLSDSSTSQAVEVKVFGNPEIKTVETSLCSAITTLKWSPSRYAIDYPHIITLSDGQRFGAIPDSDTEQTLIMSNLSASTYYTLNITVCNQTCIPLFAPSTTNFTTNGRPNEVEWVRSDDYNATECSITWKLPQTSSGVSKYQIKTTESAVVYRPGVPYNRSWNREVEDMMLQFKPRPNTKYGVSIIAVNCAGMGQGATVTPNCTLPSAAPESVPAPAIIRTESLVLPRMRLTYPNESAGLISCILVMVTDLPNEPPPISMSEHRYESDDFDSLFSSNTTSNEYVAMAISPTSFVNNEYSTFVLGEDSISACNLTDTSTTNHPNNLTCGGNIVCGVNKELRNLTQYRTNVVVIVPVEGSFLSVKRSENVFFETSPEKENTVVNPQTIVAGVLGGIACLLLLAVIGVILHRKYRVNSQEISTSISGSSRHQDYQVMNDVTPAIAYDNFSNNAVTETRLETGEPESAYEICKPTDGKRLKTDTLIGIVELESVYNRKLKSENGFSAEYRKIMRESSERNYFTRVASDPGLKSKNRYKNILPYDASRVVLNGTTSGYINASYIDGVDMPNKFIGTQGPLPKTIADFWQMIYEQDCPIIVMLTKPVESGKKKCAKYWPESGNSSSFENISVENTKEESFGGYVRRTFKIFGSGKTVSSTQYHYLNWPDHGAPRVTTHLTHMYAAMVRELKMNTKSGPIVVHCSAGAGRTGAFIAYDIILEEWKKYGAVDFYNCVMKMREQRIDMVQNTGQYTFIHKLVLEKYIHGATDYTVDEFKKIYKELSSIGTAMELNNQFQRIGRVKPLDDEILEIGGSDYVDINSQDVVQTYAHSRVHVVREGDEDKSPVIDASWIETEDANLRLIAAKTPTHSTASLYWRAVVDNGVGTIVSLSPASKGDLYYPIDAEKPLLLESGSVTLMNCLEKGSVTERRFNVEILERKAAVTMMQCNLWKKMEDPSATQIFSSIQLMKTTALQAEHRATIVQCSDGMGRSGVYCTLVNLLDRIGMESRIDVARAVKDLKDARPMMVTNQEQYNLCYKLVQTYLNSTKI